MAALQGGGGADALSEPSGRWPRGWRTQPDPGDGAEGGGWHPRASDELDSIGHIQQAMKHLMMAMSDGRGRGARARDRKGMGALQGILAGEQKSDQAALGGSSGG